MKKIILLSFSVLLFALVTNAQITKGSIYLGGSIGASNAKSESSTTSNEGKQSSFSLNPAVGIAVRHNVIAGIEFNYVHSKSASFSNNQDNKNNGYGAGLFLRKYFPLSNRFYVFGQTGLGYFHQNWDYLQTPGYNYTAQNKQSSISANLFPGLAIHVIKSLYLEAAFNNLIQLSYSATSTTANYLGTVSTSKQKGFNIGSSLTSGSYLNIGVRFIIPKK